MKGLEEKVYNISVLDFENNHNLSLKLVRLLIDFEIILPNIFENGTGLLH